LNSPLPELEDGWEVPEMTIEEKSELHNVLVGDNLIPHVTTTLTVDEREDFLIQRESEISGLDRVRVDETAASIDNITDSMFQEMSEQHLIESNQLADLEHEMNELVEISKGASVEELIQIADRIGEIELQLGNISELPNYTMLTPITRLDPKGE
jgi:hypothetical protein